MVEYGYNTQNNFMFAQTNIFVEPYYVSYAVTVAILILTWLPPKHNMITS